MRDDARTASGGPADVALSKSRMPFESRVMGEPSTVWPRRFGREIALVLVGKALGLLLLYLLFFASPPSVPPLGQHLFSQEARP